MLSSTPKEKSSCHKIRDLGFLRQMQLYLKHLNRELMPKIGKSLHSYYSQNLYQGWRQSRIDKQNIEQQCVLCLSAVAFTLDCSKGQFILQSVWHSLQAACVFLGGLKKSLQKIKTFFPHLLGNVITFPIALSFRD